MKLLDEKGIGTVWSICKEKFALVGHTHNYAGSGSPGGSANSAIGVVDYNQTGKTIQIGYSGTGITGEQIKYIAGYTDGSGNVNAKIKDVSKDALKSWLGLGSLAYSSSSIPTKLSQLTNDEGFVTGSDLSSYSQKSETVKKIYTYTVNDGSQRIGIVNANGEQSYQNLVNVTPRNDGCMSKEDKVKLDGIASGANNYTLPTASDTTLGGIKVSTNANGTGWPICVDGNGLAETKIVGLVKNNNMLSAVILSNGSSSANYGLHGVFIEDKASKNSASISFPLKSGALALISDIPTKTSQLTNDSTFLTSADKYTLPVASDTTLGGVKTSMWYTPGYSWPIYADPNNNIYTRISGLAPNNSGSIRGVTVSGDNYYTEYNDDRIIVDIQNPNAKTINFPSKSGTFALTSDIPDVSNLCGFNFVNSISDCVNGRINFLFKNSNEYVDLSFLRNLEKGTISLIYSPFVDFQITDKGSVWYYNGRSVASEDTAYIGKAKLVLAFFNDTYVYVCTFSYN